MLERTETLIDLIIRQLKAGRFPKEIAATMNVSWSYIRQLAYRSPRLRIALVDTYQARHPKAERIAPRTIAPLRRVVTK